MAKEFWRGNTEIEFEYHGDWADPELIYDGKSFNYWDIEDAMWEMFLEDSNGKWKDSDADTEECEDEFSEYVKENGVSYLNDVMAGGYFD